MTAPLTPETLAELRELERRATPIPWRPKSDGIEYEGETVLKGDLRPIDECFVAAMRNALPALLDAAEELERVKRLGAGRCNTCAFVGKKSCPKKMFDGEPRWAATNPCNGWKPGWNGEATK